MAFFAAGLAFLLACIVYLVWPNEPRYKGRSLSSWLEDYANPFAKLYSGDFGYAGQDPQSAAARAYTARFAASKEAVKAIGTNAIPVLLKYVQARDTSSRGILLLLLARSPAFRLFYQSEWQQHSMAQAGFMLLSDDARPAVSSLIELTKDARPRVRLTALECLECVVHSNANEMFPVLLRFGSDPSVMNRITAAQHMRVLLPRLSKEDEQRALGAFPELHQPEPKRVNENL
jgi:hypothetical protein